jgi:hypothetical protein
LDEVEAEFRKREGLQKFIRGKYLMLFFIKFLLEIHVCTPKFCSKHSKPPRVKLPLSIENSMSVIAPRVRCPESLKNFIRKNYIQYIKEMNVTVESHLNKSASLRFT